MSMTLNLRGAVRLAVVLCVWAGFTSAYAGAAERKPFGIVKFRKPFEIVKFTMQTIKSTTEVQEGDKLRFVNEPEDFTQAGGHPWGWTTTFEFATEKEGTGKAVTPTQDPKDIVADLPPGLLGNPNPRVFPQCPLTVVLAKEKPCPTDTQVGVFRLRNYGGEKESLAPIVNVTPEKGQSAEFGLENNAKVTFLVTAHVVRVGKTYGLTAASNEIPSVVELDEAELTFWGVPADPSHNPMRGLNCAGVDGLKACEYYNGVNENEYRNGNKTGEASGLAAVPFLTWPTDCSGGPLTATGRADSWEEAGSVREGHYTGYTQATTTMPGVTGCNLLQFEPTLKVKPDTLLADAPVGVGVNLQVPLVESTEAPATPELRDSVVTFPEGMSISPGIVDGIQACDESGPEGINFEGPESEEVGLNGELQLAPGHCPDASTIGEAEAETPLQPEPVKGHVYLARPVCGGPGEKECTEQDAAEGKLYQLYLELGGSGALADTGVNLKIRLKTEANPATGQLTTIAEDNPPFPFSELRIRLNGGPRAGLDNPAVCGPAVTTTDFTPWSEPGITPAPESLSMPGTPDATPSSFFDVAGCLDPPPLNPGFVAGTVTPNAGKFSSFTMSLSRQDREQYIKGIQVHTPPGLLGVLSSVPLCGEAQANAGTCSEASKIGTTRAASGAGSHPFELEGNVYLTGPYRGEPFGLSIVVHIVAGPFNLGVKVVRARIAVDPETSVLTVATDETGPYAVPQIVFGVPVRLKRVTVNIDRPNFMFNPTNCNAQQVTAKISGNKNAVASVSSPLAVGGCESLAFKPRFKVSTSGHTSRKNGASLDAKVAYPAGSMGKEANIARVKVSLPKQLPSRLTTLQKACLAATFDSNPATCPPGSVVGIAKTTTPLLPVQLEGPVYFVSHGGEAFPSLIVVLQGDGVRVDLTGATFINKAGITSSTFKTVPDVPVNTFELYLPQGKYSALAANGKLCKSQGKLKMPTEFVAQNGAVFKQSTKITVTGCPVAKAKVARHRQPAGQGTRKRNGSAARRRHGTTRQGG
jgi:hypothetical protein